MYPSLSSNSITILSRFVSPVACSKRDYEWHFRYIQCRFFISTYISSTNCLNSRLNNFSKRYVVIPLRNMLSSALYISLTSPRKMKNFFFCYRPAFHNKSSWYLSPFIVSHADNASFRYCRMGE